jgi:cell division protein FtsW
MRAAQGMVLIALTLLVFGVVMVNSAALQVDPDHPVTFFDMLTGRPAALAGAAILAMWAGSLVPIGILQKPVLGVPLVAWAVPISIALLLAVHLPGIGREVNGARRWLQLGPIGFQPSEVAKWGLIATLAWWAASRTRQLNSFRHGFLPPMLATAAICGLIAAEDLGTAVLIFAVAIMVLLAAGCRLWHLASLVPLAAAGFVGAVLASPYRLDRLRAFLDPYNDPQGIGYHIIQSMAAIGGGGLAGSGLGNSVQKFGYLPEDTTDFIFAITCEELGLLGAVAIVSLYCGLLFLGASIALRQTEIFRRLLVIGITSTIGLQACINILVVTGLAPTKGIALPLLSSGGTGWLLTAFCIGLIASIDRASAAAPETAPVCHA